MKLNVIREVIVYSINKRRNGVWPGLLDFRRDKCLTGEAKIDDLWSEWAARKYQNISQ